ncbi:redoxin domain-containing protein [Spongiibacter sp.]|uniref:redoxin domain-containing protein n=1 Tax=Spongiibacter sp. TaxID=2024860 RepID=UPI0035659814
MTLIKALAKRFFVLPYLLLCVAASLHCAWQMLFGSGFSLSWFGAWLSVTPVPLFVLLLYSAAFLHVSRFIVVQLIAALLGAFLVVIEMQPLPTVYALSLGLGGVLLYVFWYSYLDRDDNPLLAVGRPLPLFKLRGSLGEVRASSEFQGRKTLLLFFRGNWCPLCRSQLHEFSLYCQNFIDYGMRVALISSQPVAASKKILAGLPEEVELYSDPSLEAARALDIIHPFGTPFGVGPAVSDTVLPTLLLVDEAGVIRYVDLPENFRIGPQPRRLLAALEEHWV